MADLGGESGASVHSLQRVLASYLDIKCWMGDDLLLKVDQTTMAHALEARVPFLDHKPVEWNMRLPPEWKVGARRTKLFLREIMRNRLPAETIVRPQHGFLAPLAYWFSRHWSGYLDRMLGPSGLARRGVIPDSYLVSVRQRLAAHNKDALLPAIMLAAIECWFQTFGVTVARRQAERQRLIVRL